MNKFEKLIEYVIQDETAKAQELFHEIVVEKSRQIYESLMDDEIGGDASEDLIDDVEAEEYGLSEEEEEEVDFDDVEGEEDLDGEEVDFDDEEIDVDYEENDDLEDRVVDLEDQLEELMAEFEELMGSSEETETETDIDVDVSDSDFGGDALEVDDTQSFSAETGYPMSENIDLPRAPAPVTREPEATNKKSTTNFNSGEKGMQGKPVRASDGRTSNPDGTRATPQPHNQYSKGETKVSGSGEFKNVPGKNGSKLQSAPKPVTSQAQGVNNSTPFPKN